MRIHLLILVYVTLAVAYSLASPIYEPTDELRHIRYVRHVAVYHTLPVQQAEGPRAQSHHPPLYYALAALVSGWVPVEQDVYDEPPVNPYWGYRYWEVGVDNKLQYLHGYDELWPFRGITLAVYLMRWMTVCIGAGVVWLTYRLGRTVLPEYPTLALGASALVAFNPQFLHLSGAVNNDVPAALCGVAIVLACARLVRSGPSRRADVTLGVLYGLALLTKLHLAALAVIVALAYLIAVWPTRDWRALVRGGVIILGLGVLIAGWWFWRNYALYGDLTGMSKVNELWAGRSASENWWAIRQSLPYLWSSLWGRFGYGQIPMPEAVYRAVLIGNVVALAGWLIPRRRPRPHLPLVLLLIGVPVVFTVVVGYYILIQPAGAMGRFLFPALPAFALLLTFGLSRLVPARWWSTRAAPAIVTAGALVLALYALIVVLIPATARPRPLTPAEIDGIPAPLDVRLGDVARLRGYHVTPATIRPGDSVDVTLYWEPLARPARHYAVFIHLLSDAGTMIVQRDTYPGLGRYPTTVWTPGVVFADTYRLHVPETAYTPDRGVVQVGLYQPDGPRLVAPDGRDVVQLDAVQVESRPAAFPNPLSADFDRQITLAGYTLDRRVARPGETIRLTLYWQAQRPIEIDYRVFAQVLGVENQVWANSDLFPSTPTSLWVPGQTITETHDVTIGQTTPPGIYDVQVGIYVPDGGRLPVVAADGHWLDTRALLSTIRVLGE